MANGVNKVILIGNLGRDPELRFMANGSAVCNISLATTRSWKNKETGAKNEETEWHRVVLYDRLAEVAGEFLRKGRSAYIEGRLKTRKWTDKDGLEKYTTEIIAEQLQLMGGKTEDEGGPQGASAAPAAASGGARTSSAPSSEGSHGGANNAPAPREASNKGGFVRSPSSGSKSPALMGSGFDDMDDDIPF